jgi:hypothetical protein
MTNERMRWIAILLSGALLVACGGGGGVNDKPTPAPPAAPPGGQVRPDASNTGVPGGTLLRPWTGGATLQTPGVVLDGHDFPALPAGSYYRITADHATLRNCRMASSLLIQLATHVRVERCEIVGGVSISGAANVVLDRNHIHGSEDDLLHVTSDTGRVRHITLSNNFVHAPRPACGAHADGLQARGVDHLSLVNNVIDMGPWRQVCGLDALNAAVFLEAANGGNTHLLLDGNHLNGGGYTLRIGPAAAVRVVRNRFGRDERYGPVLVTAAPGSLVEATDNRREDTGEAVPVR